MPDHEIAPSSLTEHLCSLAQRRLQTQTTRSGTLEASSLGVMAFDAALATIALSVGRTQLWSAVLTLLCASLALAIATLGFPTAQRTGPSLARVRRRRLTEEDSRVAEYLLDGLEQGIRLNQLVLRRKEPLFKLALICLTLAVTVELAGVIL